MYLVGGSIVKVTSSWKYFGKRNGLASKMPGDADVNGKMILTVLL